ncbi:hypothetical protein MTO98_17270 [Mucilaginibacter sp. SMC90]|uniref:cytochrome-c peroxidase n=1 Tax=Mucilaginibacter sp. SMC90 TaxID=2929803 RepID=UPI001FB34775|nr:cytochrome c peroxidase [Mucilaginibacter sp. SMC90]UOE52821.1 hypothetical protein MTO98_17270 [Mucilaginibacter sp. SMC90]
MGRKLFFDPILSSTGKISCASCHKEKFAFSDTSAVSLGVHGRKGLPVNTAIWRLGHNNYYKLAFTTVFNGAPNAGNLAKELSAFERTLETGDSPFDNWRLNDNESAVSESAKRGFAIFNSKGRCIQCHFGPDFNDVEFRSIGLYDGKTLRDSGRPCVTKKVAEIGRFKIGAGKFLMRFTYRYGY